MRLPYFTEWGWTVIAVFTAFWGDGNAMGIGMKKVLGATIALSAQQERFTNKV